MYNSEFGAVFGGNKSFATKMIVGRKGEQPFLITDQTVSSRHCEITKLAEGKFHINDLDSTNGTYVNGVGIIECDVTSSETVKLGENYQLDLKKLFPLQQPTTFPLHLSKVYEDYINQKHKIAKAAKWSMNLKLFVPAIFTFLASSFFKGEDEKYNFVITAVSIGISIIITILLLIFSDNTTKQLEDLTDNFKLNYVCGNTFGGKKCGQFLGFDSPKIWESRDCICPKCKKPIK